MKKATAYVLAPTLAAMLHVPAPAACAPQGRPAPPPVTSPIETDVLVVQGRFVAADTGAPLARCRVRLTAHQSTGYDVAWRCGDWADPPEQTTGDDGRFRFEFRLPNAFEEVDRARYHLNVSHPRRLGWFSHCTFFVAQRRGGVDYGDVPLPEGVRPRIRVVDRDGELQPGVLLQLSPTAKAGEGEIWRVPGGPISWLDRSAYARTDVDGYLHLSDPLPAGEFRIQIRNREAAVEPGVVTLPSKEPIELVVEPLPDGAIAGRLLDEDGAPLGGVTVRAAGGDSSSTLRDGSFTVIPGNVRPILVEAARNRRYDRWVRLGAVDEGARDLTFELPAVELTTLVVAGPDGAPVEDFNAYCFPVGDRERSPVRLDGSYVDGRAACRLAAGEWRVRVFPRTDRLLPNDWQTVTIDRPDQEVAIRLPATEAHRVRVTFADQRPAAGARVEVLSAAPDDVFLFARPATVDTERRDGPPRVDDRPHLLAAARCGADGVATLRVQGPGRVAVRVSGDDVVTSVHEITWTGAGDPPVAVEVGRGALLQGRLTPRDAVTRLDPGLDPDRSPSIYSYTGNFRPTLVLRHENGRERAAVHIADDGTFRCTGLPPGKVDVLLQTTKKISANGYRHDRTPPTLGTFELVAGEPCDVQLKVPEVMLPAANGDEGGR